MAKAPGEMHFYDVVTGEEIVLDPKEMMKMQNPEGQGPEGGPPMMPDMMLGMPGMRMVNPKTGERTLIPMTRCPKCEKWFVTEEMKKC